jgi:hypothetical protein
LSIFFYFVIAYEDDRKKDKRRLKESHPILLPPQTLISKNCRSFVINAGQFHKVNNFGQSLGQLGEFSGNVHFFEGNYWTIFPAEEKELFYAPEHFLCIYVDQSGVSGRPHSFSHHQPPAGRSGGILC